MFVREESGSSCRAWVNEFCGWEALKPSLQGRGLPLWFSDDDWLPHGKWS